ncbi:energy transducer TonB [Xanthomonas melonis]|uniref:energy transducer TonB n=1 Tax=Xanthomonas melonis TaxID=56456 RepID=UPI003EBBF0AC
MSFTSNPSTHRPALSRHAPPAYDRRRVESDRPSLWLWATLLAVLIVIPAWWWARHGDEFVTDTAVAPVATRQILPSADGPRAMTMIPHQPARAPLDSTDAIPLPGNALPIYPADMARAGIEGGRTARLQLDVQGRVRAVTIVERTGSEDPRLDAAVQSRLLQWRFEPATRDGRAVASTLQVPVDFSAER